jgi:hypothetical protein
MIKAFSMIEVDIIGVIDGEAITIRIYGLDCNLPALIQVRPFLPARAFVTEPPDPFVELLDGHDGHPGRINAIAGQFLLGTLTREDAILQLHPEITGLSLLKAGWLAEHVSD